MGTFGSSKVAKNTTNVDNRTTDAKVAAQDSFVVTAGAGKLNYADKSTNGSLVASGKSTINVSSVDPGSYAFASEVVDRAFNGVAAAQSSAGSQVQSIGETVAKLAQGAPIGTDWKGLLLPLAVVGAVLAILFMPRKAH